MKKFKDFINENVLSNKLEYVENYLKNKGHYKDDDGYWHIGEDIELNNFFVYNGKLIVKFKEVRGSLYAGGLDLTSLEGFPEKVGGTLDLSSNKLDSLEHCPKYAKRFSIRNNIKLTSLNGAPQGVESLGMLSEITVPLIERIFYDKVGRIKYTDYYLDMLKYICSEHGNNDKFDELLKTVDWPEGFLTKELIQSVKGATKYNLFESMDNIKETILKNIRELINYEDVKDSVREQFLKFNAYDVWTYKNLYYVEGKLDDILITDRYFKPISNSEIKYLDECLQKYLKFVKNNPDIGLPKGVRDALSGSIKDEKILFDNMMFFKFKWTDFSKQFIDTLSDNEKDYLKSKKVVNKFNI